MSIPQSTQRMLDAMSPQQISNVLRSLQLDKGSHRSFQDNRKHRRMRQKAGRHCTKRTINSYMAFRSFYHVLFKGQQKESSRMLTTLWRNDKFHCKWELLARVFTAMRNEELTVKGIDLNLKDFLEITAPLLEIIEPHRYAEKMGWVLHVENGKIESMTHVQIPTNPHSTKDTLSDHDLVAYCHRIGYYTGDLGKDIFVRNRPSLLMSSSTLLPSQSLADNQNDIEPQYSEDRTALTQENLDCSKTSIITPVDLNTLNVDPLFHVVESSYWPYDHPFDPEGRHMVFDPFVSDDFDAFCLSDRRDGWCKY